MLRRKDCGSQHIEKSVHLRFHFVTELPDWVMQPGRKLDRELMGTCRYQSARDIQAWEYQPLGPFLAKNFATSISPWVVTLEALEPFRKSLPSQDPEPLPYLRAKNDFTFDVQLEAQLQTSSMNAPYVITRTNFQNLYWSISQQLAHHTVNGCNLEPGDLLASGTISGAAEESRGCMLELTWRGANPLKLPNGETRRWLEDGDRLTITGWCQGDGYRVGFGEVTGRILPAS
jgi:fumarylacetoacetase